jgi:hypothetical protein
MAEKVMPGPAQDPLLNEAACIHTKKIYDSCQAKDCIEDLRLYPTVSSQGIIDRAVSVKAGSAELLYIYIDVEPVGFNRGFYTVDLRYFYRVTADAFIGAPRPCQVSGLAVFDKRTVLFGGEGTAKTFRSTAPFNALERQDLVQTNRPIAVVEAVDPILLDVKLVDVCDHRYGDGEISEIPPAICDCFGCELGFGDEPAKRLYVSLGQFSILRLERDSQLLMPVYDYCMPNKECVCGGDECEQDPCDLFQQVQFPVEEFFPSSAIPRDQSSSGCCGS